MGQEISGSRFKKHDFEAFSRRLKTETHLLERWFAEQRFSARHGTVGFELEAWLVDAAAQPAPENVRFLQRLPDALVTPELSLFNIELNSTPLALGGNALGAMHRELSANWLRCREAAAAMGLRLAMIGILPTVRDEVLTLANMSLLSRYKALNEQVMRLRGGRALVLEIQGREHLRTEHHDVMLEAATTSFQIHLQVAQGKAARYFNVATILSAPMVAVSANSPLLFGRRLWQESRIPLFEQAVDIGGIEGAAFGPLKRVTFGSGYVRESMFELFHENLEHYPMLLPVELDEQPETLSHLRLQNGTIWRWNRPLVGFDEDGTPHLRIEHRVVPAGPSVIDSIANAALFFGLMTAIAEQERGVEVKLDFARARDNFYNAAKHSLDASIVWLDGRNWNLQELFRRRLLPMAREGLEELSCAAGDIDRYLGIIDERGRTGRTGAAWQGDYVEQTGSDMAKLLERYLELQDSGMPVHEWPI
ncbi:glutamate-cysteine ligase family protein [Thiohalomonas denitrificans]|uniref:glutamate-cysteine ligase family protein n=1 Tax=Thiohalomonas denitrificans TaxID=415747 RepID=UPI0026EC2BE2|nr:glutamate-cysteine ligase family protein [Thiohalomonas denitrificans]